MFREFRRMTPLCSLSSSTVHTYHFITHSAASWYVLGGATSGMPYTSSEGRWKASLPYVFSHAGLNHCGTWRPGDNKGTTMRSLPQLQLRPPMTPTGGKCCCYHSTPSYLPPQIIHLFNNIASILFSNLSI